MRWSKTGCQIDQTFRSKPWNWYMRKSKHSIYTASHNQFWILLFQLSTGRPLHCITVIVSNDAKKLLFILKVLFLETFGCGRVRKFYFCKPGFCERKWEMKRKELLNMLSLRLWTVSDLAATLVNSPPASWPASGIRCPLHENNELASNVDKIDTFNKLHIYPMWEICTALLALDLKLNIKINLQVISLKFIVHPGRCCPVFKTESAWPKHHG